MPVTASVSVSKKIGLPDYGSLGASCSVQFEVDPSTLQKDPAAFQQAIRNAYVAVAQAVEDELSRHSEGVCHADHTRITQKSPAPTTQTTNGHQASDKQLGYARQLAQQI